MTYSEAAIQIGSKGAYGAPNPSINCPITSSNSSRAFSAASLSGPVF
jgi:hypothetical protein